VITFLLTVSGVVIAGVGAPFWGLLGGGAVLGLVRIEQRVRAGRAPAPAGE
jgi:benzoate membrane transport protein